VAGAELRHGSTSGRGPTLNAMLAVAAEALGGAIDVFLIPSLVLAFFVAELTPSYTTIGLVPAIATGFWTLARLPAHLITGSRRRKKPWALAAALVRASAVAIIAAVALRTGATDLSQSARPLLGTFFLCLIVYALAGGFGSVPSHGLMRAAMPGPAWLSFVRWRALASALLSLLAGLLVAGILGAAGSTFPGTYGRLFLLATVCLVASAVLTAMMREPGAAGTATAAPPLSPRTLRQPLYDWRYRRFLLFRVLFSATAAIDPFLVLYAVTRLGAPVTAIGSYVLAGVLGWVVTAPLWQWLEQRSGARAVLQGATVVRLVAPALALAIPPLAATARVREQFADGSVLTTAYAAAIFAIGAALAAQARGNYDHLAGLAPRQHFATYIALTNLVLAVAAFSPVVGGLIIQRSGYEALFGVAITVGLAAVFAAGTLARTPASGGARARDDRARSATPRALRPGRA
jgi:hypothetical protein